MARDVAPSSHFASGIAVGCGICNIGYIALTGKWITWPYRPRRIPATAQRRRSAGLAGVGLVLGLALLDSNLLRETRDVPGCFVCSFSTSPCRRGTVGRWIHDAENPNSRNRSGAEANLDVGDATVREVMDVGSTRERNLGLPSVLISTVWVISGGRLVSPVTFGCRRSLWLVPGA